MSKAVFIRCLGCGTVNRVYKDRLEKKPVCGKCAKVLDARRYSYDFPADISDETFEQEVLKSRLPVIVDCWAPWCAACTMIGAIMEKFASDFKARLKVVRLNTDQNTPTAARHEISSIPTLLVFKGGVLVDKVVGILSEHQLKDIVNKWL
ncbi:MAG: thioredoxin [Candidatus Hydrogenedentes bacterium]|nr:thioredoxin [Candidatus Hydrogenedentota bacterium]